jgi:hypothetical protein
VTSFNRFSIFFPVLLLIILSASFVFAAAEQKSYDNTAGQVCPAKGTPAEALVDITSEYSQGMHVDFSGQATAPAPREIALDSPTDFSSKYFRQQLTLPFYDSKETKWCLAPLSDNFSFNPMTDIRNLKVLLQYKF